MKKLAVFVTIGFLSVTLGYEKEEDLTQGFKIEGLTIESFLRLDGSTSNEPLNRIIACKLLGYRYKWIDLMPISYYSVTTDNQETNSILYNLLKTSQIHNAFVNLIDGNVDIIMSASKKRMLIEEYRNAVKTITINGITPNRETILNLKYPFVTEVYTVIRSDLDKNSMACKLYELLQTNAGRSVIAESGYIPNGIHLQN
jgi:hypothetical protein